MDNLSRRGVQDANNKNSKNSIELHKDFIRVDRSAVITSIRWYISGNGTVFNICFWQDLFVGFGQIKIHNLANYIL